MISIAPQETKQSTTCEGVSFVIRKLSSIQRSVRDLPIFEHILKAQELTKRFWELTGEREKLEKASPAWPLILRITDLEKREDLNESEVGDLVSLRHRLAEIADEPALVSIRAQAKAVDFEFSLIQAAYLVPAAIRAGLVSIAGVEIAGVAATPESIATNATPELNDLVREIYVECEFGAGLLPVQRKNSQSPIISNEPGTGEKNSSTAATASA